MYVTFTVFLSKLQFSMSFCFHRLVLEAIMLYNLGNS